MSSKLKIFIIVIVLVIATVVGIYISDNFLNFQNKQLNSANDVATEFIEKSCNTLI